MARVQEWQIFVSVCTYVLIAIAKKRLKLPNSLNEILQILSLNMFEKTPINQLLKKPDPFNDSDLEPKQLSLLWKTLGRYWLEI